MKAPLSSKNYVALALVAMVLSFMSSCRDQDFDWEDAHANTQQLKFDNVFIREFGRPAEGHQWGFDLANIAMGGDLNIGGTTRAVYKMETNMPGNIRLGDYLGKPNNITENEHKDVYAWFSNHKVNWKNTPCNSDNESSKETNGPSIAYLRQGESGYTLKEYVSLNYYTPESTLGDYAFHGIETPFVNAWIQNVAKEDKSKGMEQMKFHSYAGGVTQKEHLNEFNSNTAYGWGNQDNYQNAILVTNAEFFDASYMCTQTSSWQNKYILVYLKGEDYEGWYMGFDYEGDGAQKIAADGVCNDWIIKIVNLGDNNPYNPARIMCEDLGGVSTSDIDYNDIVLDVEASSDKKTYTLTLQAAGGTLPLIVTYEDQPLFETHEYFEKYADWGVATKSEISYDLMYNTGEAVCAQDRKYTLYFDGASRTGDHQKTFASTKKFELEKIHIKVYRLGVEDYISESDRNVKEAQWTDLGNFAGIAPLKICVPAVDGNGNQVRWLKERQSIKKGYPAFLTWVTDPMSKFWEGSNVSGYLYGSNDEIPEDDGDESSETTPTTPAAPDLSKYGTSIIFNSSSYTIDCSQLPKSGNVTINIVFSGANSGANGRLVFGWDNISSTSVKYYADANVSLMKFNVPVSKYWDGSNLINPTATFYGDYITGLTCIGATYETY